MESNRCLFIGHDGQNQIGGVHTWLGSLMPRLRDRGLNVSVALFLRPGEGLLTPQLRESNIRTFTHSHFGPFSDRIRWLSRVIEQTGTRVVVPNYILAGFAAAARFRKLGVRTVAVMHSDDPLYRALIQCRQKSDPAVHFDHAVPVSCFLEKLVQDSLGREFPNTRIPCGIELGKGEVSKPSGQFRLVYVGRIAQEQKRICDVVAAFCRVIREIPGVTADIIGSGPDLRAAEDVLIANGSPKEVRLLGELRPKDVQKRLPQYHAIVLLSDYEGLPVAILEAMAVGLVPVCTPARSGINELVIDRHTGLIVENREESFVSAIRELSQNLTLWRSLSTQAREQVLTFDAESCAGKWAGVLNQTATMKVSATSISKLGSQPVPRWLPEFDWDMQRKPSRLKISLANLRVRLGRYRRAIFPA
jgi:glycosyltransferase involved in cell wall biosynthesis